MLAVLGQCILINLLMNSHRSGNLIRITKDGFRLLSWLCLRIRVIKFSLLHGRLILAGNTSVFHSKYISFQLGWKSEISDLACSVNQCMLLLQLLGIL